MGVDSVFAHTRFRAESLVREPVTDKAKGPIASVAALHWTAAALFDGLLRVF
jgi:hypothetical protein